MRKDNIDLICSVAELSGLFEKRSNVGGFLQDVVELVAGHMLSDVCSIYLYDQPNDSLVLRATRGLNPASVGSVRLSLGEGLTGLALKQLRPIREGKVHENPDFKTIPEVHEEEYHSFLAVPIRRGLTRIGVISLQHRKISYFDEHDTKALRAIASQLAATLENASLLMDLHNSHEKYSDSSAEEPGNVLSGTSACAGVGTGFAVHLDSPDSLQAPLLPRLESLDAEVDRFQNAIEKSRTQLEHLQVETEKNFSDVASLIFSSHLLMLRDEEFSGQMLDSVRDGVNPGDAVRNVVERYEKLFSGMNNPRLQEKVQDVKDLGHRILRNLGQATSEHGDYADQIVIAHELYPSELVKLAAQHVEGIVIGGSTVTSHISILARSLDIPVVSVHSRYIFKVPAKTELIVDGHSGTVHVEPDETTRRKYRDLHEKDSAQRVEVREVPPRAFTACGEHVRVMANVNLINDVRFARENNAEGVGLYRSEFPFIVRNDFPSEEEQHAIYTKIIDQMDGEEIVLRTLDIGGDKLGPTGETRVEANPFLGQRGIRFSLANRDIFTDQLRAMLRAGSGADLSIMFPMISGLDEFLVARELVTRCIEELEREGIAFNHAPKIGAMIELPSAIEIAAELDREADFICVGTNDLTMYMLGVDRTNERVSDLFVNHNPAVLRCLARLASDIRDVSNRLSICGEAAADPVMVPFFVGLGIRRLSVEPRLIPSLKEDIGALKVKDAEQICTEMLEQASISGIERYIESKNIARSDLGTREWSTPDNASTGNAPS